MPVPHLPRRAMTRFGARRGIIELTGIYYPST
jgi:hypothetical protein